MVLVLVLVVVLVLLLILVLVAVAVAFVLFFVLFDLFCFCLHTGLHHSYIVVLLWVFQGLAVHAFALLSVGSGVDCRLQRKGLLCLKSDTLNPKP